MSSITQKTEKRRAIRQKTAGKQAKKARAKQGTPPFPLDPAQAGPDSAEKQAAKK
ncbi:MAG: hypothetical protein KC619_20790 [Myxococcales bacterium]|nr:hypothetical protein [Myxococcales bacterium]